ncbi:MAG: hypothetical protein CYG61_05510 [Actinobacteria bacterium]|nr:MAG: hypothetical protein CYG61_05510 [Actinomycetota bacterium]
MNPGDARFSLSTSVPAGTETASASTGSHTVCDVAGRCTTADPVAGHMVDKKGPTITVASPTQTQYVLNQGVATSYACTDGGSGIATCAGPGASGTNLATASPGARTFNVTATDSVGSSATTVIGYTVTYGVCVMFDETKAYNRNSTVPVRLRLCDAARSNVSSPTITVKSVGLKKKDNSASTTVEDSGGPGQSRLSFSPE